MKITTRTVMKMLRLYGLADDATSVRDFRSVKITPSDDSVKVSLILKNSKYVVFFGSLIDDSDIHELWPDMPEDAIVLDNPLDNESKTTPFRGKYLLIATLPSKTQRLDNYLAKEFDPNISRSLWQKYIKLGCVSVNGNVVLAPKAEIKDTDTVTVVFPKEIDDKHDLPILYIDEDIVVLNKSAGILTHAKGGISQEQTVADFAKKYTTYGLGTDRPGIVHRLDRDTSGVIIIARHEASAKFIQKQFADRKVDKTYIAIVMGAPKLDKAKIELPIARNPSKPSTFRVDSNGKSAETVYSVLGHSNKTSLVELKPKTGRTHQLRVHMAHIGTPIAGDRVYGKPGERLMLHAYQLKLLLPSGSSKTFTSKIPEEFLIDFPGVKI